MKSQDCSPVTQDRPWLFKKGADPRRLPGGIDPKTRRIRKKLARFDDIAMQTLGRLFASEEPTLMIEALKFWGKYRLPVPTVATPLEVSVTPNIPNISPELAAKIAAMDS